MCGLPRLLAVPHSVDPPRVRTTKWSDLHRVAPPPIHLIPSHNPRIAVAAGTGAHPRADATSHNKPHPMPSRHAGFAAVTVVSEALVNEILATYLNTFLTGVRLPIALVCPDDIQWGPP